MTSVGAAYISKQPRDYDIQNSFGLMGNEHFLRDWTYKEGPCECGDTHSITLTDTRLLLRAQESTCCCCCGEPGHTDATIFLRDIAELRETTEGLGCCALCCAHCFGSCCRCCCQVPKYIQIRGSFGSEILYVSKKDSPKLRIEIPAAIGNHKLVSQY
jgi:hypothetical protein